MSSGILDNIIAIPPLNHIRTKSLVLKQVYLSLSYAP